MQPPEQCLKTDSFLFFSNNHEKKKEKEMNVRVIFVFLPHLQHVPASCDFRRTLDAGTGGARPVRERARKSFMRDCTGGQQ